MFSLSQEEEQWDILRNGADIDTAVEEFIRYVTPIHNMCRVATEDYVINGKRIKKGQQVLLMYSSANRDPEKFVEITPPIVPKLFTPVNK